MGTRKERLEAAGSISEKILGWKCSVEGQRVYTHESEGQKTNSGYKAFQGRGYLPSVGHVAFSPPPDIVLYSSS